MQQRWTHFLLLGCVLSTGCPSNYGCSSDSECRDGRICQNRECVDRTPSAGTAQCGATIVACNCATTPLQPGQVTNNTECASGRGQANPCSGSCAGGGVPWTIQCYCGGNTTPDAGTMPAAGMKLLPIAPIAQQTLEWCWLASAEMIFRYFNIPPVNNVSYQCGIMGAVTGPQSVCFYDCSQCVFGSGSDAASAMVLEQYPALLQQSFYPQQRIPQITSQLEETALSPQLIEQIIDAGYPIELGITVGSSFMGMAGHDVVLVGYDAASDGTFSVIINDPFPYDAVVGSANNPYYPLGATALQPGQYSVEYSRAVTGLQWSASILVQPH